MTSYTVKRWGLLEFGLYDGPVRIAILTRWPLQVVRGNLEGCTLEQAGVLIDTLVATESQVSVREVQTQKALRGGL